MEAAELAQVHYMRQGEPRGLGHAVLCADMHVGDEPFAVLLGDDLIDTRNSCPGSRCSRSARNSVAACCA